MCASTVMQSREARLTEECSPSCMSRPRAFLASVLSDGLLLPASSRSGPYEAVSRV